MHYKYGFVNGHFVIEKKTNIYDNTFYQEHEYLFNKELSKTIATCIHKYVQVADFCYREKYKKQLIEDQKFLEEIWRG